MSTLTTTSVMVFPPSQRDWPLLAEMYAGIEGNAESLSLPPIDLEMRAKWLDKFRQDGINFIAVSGHEHNDRIAGHLALMPCGRTAEMAVFVRKDQRHQGIGKALAGAAVEEARRRGLRSIWVLISSSNAAAWQGLRKFGFHTTWESQGEVQLTFPL